MGKQQVRTYFQDLELDRTLLLGEWLVSKSESIAFAEAWEPQPYHTSEAAAAESIHGRLTCCSLYLFAICTKLFFDYEKPFAVLAMLGKDQIVLPSPACPGDRLYYRTRCIAKRPSQSRPGAGIVVLQDTLSTEPGQLVLEQKVSLLLERSTETI